MSDKVIVTIGKTTQAVLQSFMKINNSIVFNELETNSRSAFGFKMSSYKNWHMPKTLALNSLNKLLSALKMSNTEEVEIRDDHLLITNTANPKESIKLFFAEEEHIETLKPGFEEIIPKHSVEF